MRGRFSWSIHLNRHVRSDLIGLGPNTSSNELRLATNQRRPRRVLRNALRCLGSPWPDKNRPRAARSLASDVWSSSVRECIAVKQSCTQPVMAWVLLYNNWQFQFRNPIPQRDKTRQEVVQEVQILLCNTCQMSPILT